MKTLLKVLKALAIALIVLIAGFAILIILAILTDYRPDEKEIISQPESPSMIRDSSYLTLLTWNIGYAGLDKDMDFFYDGGTKVITPKNSCIENLDAIKNYLKSNDTIDFILIQEIDRKSKRSYSSDQFKIVSEALNTHEPFFAKNYDVFFVPTPPSKPMGKVFSGIAIYSDPVPESSTRFSLPGDFGFPTQLFYLDRCFLVNRYKVSNGKDLVLVNTHNEAFDEEGDIREVQMEKLKEFVTNEYSSGNYVITGGDWNQCPPDFIPEFKSNKVNTSQMVMESGFLSNEWKWVYDPTTPSNRTVISPYNPSVTTTTVIDFFLLSPNIDVAYIKCQQLDFVNSDHNPVITRIFLK